MFAYLFSHPIYSNTAPFFYGCVLAGLGFFFSFFLGTFSVILGPDGEGHGSASFVQTPL